MTGTNAMRVAVRDRAQELRQRLRSRLDEASRLRCPEHDQGVTAVMIDARENGWFDCTWTTCCAGLEQSASLVLKNRC